MKALSIYPPYAMAIAAGVKTIEVRTWKTDYRGPILICSTAKKLKDTIPGHALCVVDLADIVHFQRSMLKDAGMHPADYAPGMFGWVLKNPRYIKPIPVKGKLSLWTFDHDDQIEILATPAELEADAALDERLGAKYWEPLIV